MSVTRIIALRREIVGNRNSGADAPAFLKSKRYTCLFQRGTNILRRFSQVSLRASTLGHLKGPVRM